MWIVWKGRAYIVMYDTRKKRSVYIHERKWEKMSAEQKKRYV